MNYFVIGIVIALIFALERVVVETATRLPAGRRWLRRHWFLHPNGISLVRTPMGIVSISFWMAGYEVLSICWFAFWMITDMTDGTIARRCQLETPTGNWLDPLSDKLLYFPALLFFSWYGVLPWHWIVPLVIIDSFGQASRLLVKKKAANVFGKSKTALITILLLLAAFHKLSVGEGVENIFTVSIFPDFLYYLTVFATLLAFLSVYCKVVPDNWYANSLSLANFACGLTAVYYVLQEHPLFAFILVFIGQFFDLFDGRMARKYGSTIHGDFFDDIADGTSFGLAVGFIIYFKFDETTLALIAAVLYFLAVVYRLVRFLRHQERLDPGIFEGIPAPAGALLAGSSALLLPGLPAAGISLVFLSVLLMISRMHYRHFARKMWVETPNIFKVTVCLLVLLLISRAMADQEYELTFKVIAFIFAWLYLIFGNEALIQWLRGEGQDKATS